MKTYTITYYLIGIQKITRVKNCRDVEHAKQKLYQHLIKIESVKEEDEVVDYFKNIFGFK